MSEQTARTIKTYEASLLRDVTFVIFKRKVVLLSLVVVGLLVLIYGMMTVVPEYEATARLMVKRQPQGYAMPTESRAVLKQAEVVNSELQIIMSSAVAERVVDELGMAEGDDRPLAVYNLERRLKAKAQTESDIIDITYKHGDPEVAAAVVNTALEAYLDVRKNVAFNYEAVQYLDAQAARVKAERDSVAMLIAEFGGEHGQLEIGRLALQHMGLKDGLKNEYNKLSKAVRAFKTQMDMLDAWLESDADLGAIPNSAIYEMASVNHAKLRLVNMEADLAAARSKYPEDHSQVQRAIREIDSMKESIREEVEQAVAIQKMRLVEWQLERDSVREEIGRLESKDEEIMQQYLILRLLEHDLSIRADLYAIIMDRREQFNITAATDPSLMNVGIVSKAAIPAKPTPRPVNMRAVVGVFTILFGVMLIFALEKMDHTLERREDIQLYLDTKLLASIPDRR